MLAPLSKILFLFSSLVGLTSLFISTGTQRLTGLDSSKNHSCFVRQPSQGRVPVAEQIFILLTPSGTFQSIEGSVFNIAVMILFQIGEAPVTPEATLLIGELSLLPTQVNTK